MTLGGRAAEEIAFGEITTGASDDISRVTRAARAMVTRYGMSERLGPMMFGQQSEMVFLGREISEQRDYSEAVAQVIDEEVKKIVDEAHQRAHKVLAEKRGQLELIAQRLLEVETIDYEEFLELMGESARTVHKRDNKDKGGSKPAQTAPREEGNEVPPKLGTSPSPA